MKKDSIDTLFENLHNNFDVELPSIGHENRFLNKLKNNDQSLTLNSTKKTYWKPLIAVAASIILCLSLFTIMQQEETEVKDLASVSPELSETQNFFTTTIANELATLNNERSPETEVLIDDAMKQLNILESEYETLKMDLSESGDDKRVIYAMISNFQNRINVLQNVLQNIEEVKQFKQTTL